MTIAAGWWNAPTRFLPSGRSTAGLAADRGVDLGDERRRDVDDGMPRRYVAARKPGRIAERAAADRDDGLVALHPEARQLARGGLDDRQPLGRLALGQAGRARPSQPPAARSAGERRADGRPRPGLGDEDRPAAPQPAQCLGRRRPRRCRRPMQRRARSGVGRAAGASSPEGRRGASRSSIASTTTASTSVTPPSRDARRGVEPLPARRRGREACRSDRGRRRAGGRAATAAEPLGQHLRPAVEPDRRAAAVQRPAIAWIHDRAAAGRDDAADFGPASAGAEGADRRAARSAAERRPRRPPRRSPGSSVRPPCSISLVEVDEGRRRGERRAAARPRSCRSRAARRGRRPSVGLVVAAGAGLVRAGQAVAGCGRGRRRRPRRPGTSVPAIRAGSAPGSPGRPPSMSPPNFSSDERRPA